MNSQVAGLAADANNVTPLRPQKPWRALHRDQGAFDEVTIKLQERWKESHLSGDEWRFSALVEFKRNGRVLATKTFGSMDTAINHLGWHALIAGENGELAFNDLDEKCCDQPGCTAEPVVTYRLKKRYCNDGHASDPHTPTIRRFCARHKHRGDCGLDDNDGNYEAVTLNPDGSLPG